MELGGGVGMAILCYRNCYRGEVAFPVLRPRIAHPTKPLSA